MEHLIAIAKERGLESIWGTVLAENTQMLALARKSGFGISKASDVNEYELRIDLKNTS